MIPLRQRLASGGAWAKPYTKRTPTPLVRYWQFLGRRRVQQEDRGLIFHSDCTMADRPLDLIEGEEAGEDFTRKKKSKFQTFKNFFAKKKKNREPSAPAGENKLKPSQSSSDLCAQNLNSDVLHLLTEPGSRGSMGNKALSHDSVFISESLPDVTSHTCSQENLPGKVKALQLRLQQNLRLGSPPLVIAGKKTEDAGAISEDDGLPRSPPEISTLHNVLTCSTSTVPSESSSRALSPLSSAALGSPAFPGPHLLPVDFDSPATPLGCLDTSAARHRIAMNPRKQKAFAGKTQNLLAERVEKEECLLRVAEGKTSHVKLLEEAAGQERDRKGPSAQNTNLSNGDWIRGARTTIKASDALRYSWNAGPGTDWGGQNLTETDLQAGGPKAQPPLAKCEDEPMEGERIKGMDSLTGDLRIQPHSTGKEMVESLELLNRETGTTELCDMSPSLGRVAGNDLDVPAERRQEAKDSNVGSNGICGEGRAVEDSFDTLEANPVLVPFPSSSLEGPSEAEQATFSTSANRPEVKEDTGGSADGTLQPLEGRARPTASPQEELAKPDRLPLRSMVGEKPLLSAELSCPVSQGQQEALRNLAATGSAESASKSGPPDRNTGDHSGSVKTRGEESKTPNEMVKTLSRSVSAKPVRFTIAPAWQRSLSGGSNSTDGSCPRSSPSSPIRSELFEGIPQWDSTGQSSPERLDRSHRSRVSNLNSANEWPNEETQGHESPFGVKLRRTSSLLRYQMEQKHQEPPKQSPAGVSRTSSVSVKAETKSPGSGAPLQNLPSSAKVLVPKQSFQEQKKPLKAKLDEGPLKQPMGRASEHIPVPPLETPPSEPAWISVAKIKRRGFQSHPFAKGEKKEEKTSSKAEQPGEKRIRISQQEKQATLTGEKLLKKTSTDQGCVLETGVLPKITVSATKAPLVRTAAQEAPLLEKEMRSLPSLSLSSCSPTEPPWLSLAKKKAKAWSEMPQIVQ
ncbi:acrosomal protein KIAA1210 homolog isoform X3 [Pogona vitticeps]